MEKQSIRTLQDLVRASASAYGNKVFIKEKKNGKISEKTFRQFYDDVCRIVGYVNSTYGDHPLHAAVIGSSSYEWLISCFGIFCGGNTAVPLDAQLSCKDICDLLNRSDTEIFFYGTKYKQMIPDIHKNCPNVKEFISFETDLPKILDNHHPAALKFISPDSLAVICYTSGTTGKSKGVMLLHRNLIDNTMCQDNESTPEDVVMSVLPIHHIYCFTCDVLCSMRYGAELCFNDSMLRIAQNLKLFRPTIMLLVPMIAETIYKQIQAASAAKPEIPMSEIAKSVFGGRLKTIYSGGAYLRPELQRAYINMGFQMAQGYGMTECSPRISTGNRFDVECAGDVGVIVNGCHVKISDGEILVQSPSVMAGYYHDEAATAEALTKDGWLRTGDLGYVDEKNRIFITGRKKNLIILSNGENVSPEELENKFSGINYINEVMVYSDDGVICAEIFPNSEACAHLTESELKKILQNTVDNINKTVPSSKTIRRLRIRDVEFEKTTSKKLIRSQSKHGWLIK